MGNGVVARHCVAEARRVEQPQEAEVIALGTGKRDDNGKVHPFEVKVGDRVLVSKYGGTEVKLDEQKYTLVREDDILGVIA